MQDVDRCEVGLLVPCDAHTSLRGFFHFLPFCASFFNDVPDKKRGVRYTTACHRAAEYLGELYNRSGFSENFHKY